MATSFEDRTQDRIRRKTERMTEQTTFLESEVSSEDNADQCASVQELVFDVVGHGYSWRSFVAMISENAELIDFRAARPVIEELARRSIELCNSVELLSVSVMCPIEDASEISIVRHELENSLEWISQWPVSDSVVADASRRDIQEGRFCGIDDLLCERE